jgi:hypothetical protein
MEYLGTQNDRADAMLCHAMLCHAQVSEVEAAKIPSLRIGQGTQRIGSTVSWKDDSWYNKYDLFHAGFLVPKYSTP